MSVFTPLFRVRKPISSCQHNSRTSLRALLIALYVSLICMLDQAQAASHFSVTVQGQGQPILLIPGLMSDQRIWQQTADQLDDRYQLHLVSIQGFAGNSPVTGPILPEVKQQLLAYIQHHKLQRPMIIGHSLGAFLAFDLASSAPDLIGKIIAVDGLPYLAPVFTRDSNSTVASMQAQAEGIRRFYQQLNPTQLAAAVQPGLPIQARSQAHQALVLQMSAASDPTTVGQAVYELLTTDLRENVAKIQQPVLLLGAGGTLPDASMRPAITALYQQQIAKIPQATLRFHWQSRHFMMLDEPQWLLTEINQFLQP